jgi:hypothetical protein
VRAARLAWRACRRKRCPAVVAQVPGAGSNLGGLGFCCPTALDPWHGSGRPLAGPGSVKSSAFVASFQMLANFTQMASASMKLVKLRASLLRLSAVGVFALAGECCSAGRAGLGLPKAQGRLHG